MKKQLVPMLLVVLLLFFGILQDARAAGPAFGFHQYSSSYSELVLDSPSAKALVKLLADNSDTFYVDQQLQQLADAIAAAGYPPATLASSVYKALRQLVNVAHWVMSWWKWELWLDNGAIEKVRFREWYGVPYEMDTFYYDDNTLLRELHSPSVYVVIGRAKLPIHTEQAFLQNGYRWSDIRVVPEGFLKSVTNYPLENTLMVQHGDGTVYVIKQGLKYALTYWGFISNGYSWANIHVVPSGSLSDMVYGGTIY